MLTCTFVVSDTAAKAFNSCARILCSRVQLEYSSDTALESATADSTRIVAPKSLRPLSIHTSCDSIIVGCCS